MTLQLVLVQVSSPSPLVLGVVVVIVTTTTTTTAAATGTTAIAAPTSASATAWSSTANEIRGRRQGMPLSLILLLLWRVARPRPRRGSLCPTVTCEVLGTPASRAEGRGVDMTGGGLVPTPTAALVVVVVLPAGTLPTPTGVFFTEDAGGAPSIPTGTFRYTLAPVSAPIISSSILWMASSSRSASLKSKVCVLSPLMLCTIVGPRLGTFECILESTFRYMRAPRSAPRGRCGRPGRVAWPRNPCSLLSSMSSK